MTLTQSSGVGRGILSGFVITLSLCPSLELFGYRNASPSIMLAISSYGSASLYTLAPHRETNQYILVFSTALLWMLHLPESNYHQLPIT